MSQNVTSMHVLLILKKSFYCKLISLTILTDEEIIILLKSMFNLLKRCKEAHINKGQIDLPTVIRRRLSSLKEVVRNFRVSRAGATNDIIFTALLVIMPHEKRFTCLCLISNHARSMPFNSAKTTQCDETSKRDNSVGKERKEKSFF